MKARFLSWLPSVRQTSFHIERCDLKHRAAQRVEDGERANAEEGGFYPHLSIFASSSNQSAAKHDDERIQHSYLVRRPRSNLLIPFRRWMLRVRSYCDLD